MKFNWDLIGRIDDESDRKYEIVEAVKDSIPMDEINPPLNDAEKEYYKVTEYMVVNAVGENGDRHKITFDFTVNNG